MYYNVAPLSQTPTAVDLLTQAWARTHRSQKIGKSDVPRILQSIKVNSSRLEPAISGTTQGSPYEFANPVAQGDLLLLADRSSEAQQSFLKSCKYAVEDWDLPQSLEGMAQAVRNQDGSINRARALVNAWRAGHSVAMGIALPPNVRKGELEDAARQVVAEPGPVRAEFPRASGDLLDPVNLPPADSSEPAFALPVSDPIVLARLAPQSDPELRNWLDRWQDDYRHGQKIDQQQRDELLTIVNRSKLPNETLLAMLDAFHAISNDTATSTEWLNICARCISPDFANWFAQRHQYESPSAFNDAYEEISRAVAPGRSSCELLYLFGEAVNDITDNPHAYAPIFAVAVTRGDERLSHYRSFDDSMRPVLQAMKDCEYYLWHENETRGVPECLDAIDTLSSDLLRWVPEDDPSLGWTRIWSKIAMAECATARRNPDKALSILQTVATDSLSEPQKAGLAWARALALLQERRDDLALKQLQICASNKSDELRDGPWKALIITYSKLGDKPEAKHAFDYWIHTYHPSLSDAA